MTIIEPSRDARDFMDRAMHIRPHPNNPHKIDAAAVARFVDTTCVQVAVILSELEHESERLREALLEYAAHQPGCPAQPGFRNPSPCTCGLADILKEMER